jgi:hypothetical protein
MKPLSNLVAAVKTRDEFHAIAAEWWWRFNFRYDSSLPQQKIISAARRQNNFIVATALTECGKFYDNLGR